MASYHEMWKMIEENSFEIDCDLSVFVSCIICDKLSIDACEGACGCIYCRKCINQLIIDKEIKICPNGKDQCMKIGHDLPKTVKANNHVNKQISQLQVKCPSNACNYKCVLLKMVDHLNKCDKLPTKSSFNIKIIKKTDPLSTDFHSINNMKDLLETEFANFNKLLDSKISKISNEFSPKITASKDSLEELQQDLLTIKQKIGQINVLIQELTKSTENRSSNYKGTNTNVLNTKTVAVDKQNKEEEEMTEITLDNIKLIKEIIQLEKQKITDENKIKNLKEECDKQSRELKHIKNEEHQIRRELCQLKKGKHKQAKELIQMKKEKEKLLKEIKILAKEKQIQIPLLSVRHFSNLQDNVSPNNLDLMSTNISNPNKGSQLIGSFSCPFNRISRIDTNNGSDKFYFVNNSIEIWLRMWPNGCRRGFHRKESNNICIDYLMDDGIIRHEDKERRFPRTYTITLTLRPKVINADNRVSYQQKVELDGSNSYHKIFTPSQFHFLKTDLNSKNIIKDDCVIIECDVELVHKSTSPSIFELKTD